MGEVESEEIFGRVCCLGKSLPFGTDVVPKSRESI